MNNLSKQIGFTLVFLCFPLSVILINSHFERQTNTQAANSWLAAISVAACRGQQYTDLGEYKDGVISVYCIDSDSKNVRINIETDPVLTEWIKSIGIEDGEYWGVQLRETPGKTPLENLQQHKE